MSAVDTDALIEAINTWPKFGVDERGRIVPWNDGYEPYVRLRDVVIAITGMSTIEPQRKGKWIKTGQSFVFPEKFMNYSCSECGYDVDKIKFNFCPSCGAKMDMREEL